MSTQSRIINKKINKISSRWGVRNNKKNSAKERKKIVKEIFFFKIFLFKSYRISSRWGVRNNKKNSAKQRMKKIVKEIFFLKAIGRNWEVTVIKLFVHSLYVENVECVGHPQWKIALRKVHGRGISDQINWREVFLSLWKMQNV